MTNPPPLPAAEPISDDDRALLMRTVWEAHGNGAVGSTAINVPSILALDARLTKAEAERENLTRDRDEWREACKDANARFIRAEAERDACMEQAETERDAATQAEAERDAALARVDELWGNFQTLDQAYRECQQERDEARAEFDRIVETLSDELGKKLDALARVAALEGALREIQEHGLRADGATCADIAHRTLAQTEGKP